MNKIQICEIWKSLDSVFISKQTKFIYKNKENKTQTNNKCLNNWVIMSQLQLALAMILQVCCRNGTQFLQNTFPHLLFR